MTQFLNKVDGLSSSEESSLTVWRVSLGGVTILGTFEGSLGQNWKAHRLRK